MNNPKAVAECTAEQVLTTVDEDNLQGELGIESAVKSILKLAMTRHYYHQILARPDYKCGADEVSQGVNLRVSLETLIDALCAKIGEHPAVKQTVEEYNLQRALGVAPAQPTAQT